VTGPYCRLREQFKSGKGLLKLKKAAARGFLISFDNRWCLSRSATGLVGRTCSQQGQNESGAEGGFCPSGGRDSEVDSINISGQKKGDGFR